MLHQNLTALRNRCIVQYLNYTAQLEANYAMYARLGLAVIIQRDDWHAILLAPANSTRVEAFR